MAYYCIDPVNGDDGTGAPGDTQALAEATPYQNWSAVSWVQGSTYLQKRGTTYTSQITIGTHSITIDAYGEGTKPIIDVSGGSNHCILANSKSFITIRNIIVKNSNNNGITLWATPTNPGTECVVYNCEAYDCVGSGIQMSGTSFSTTPCIRTDSIIDSCYAFNCGDAGMKIVDGQQDCIIRNCVAVECCQTQNSWGIYMRSRGAKSTGTWVDQGSNVWQMLLSTSSPSFSGEDIKRVIVADRNTSGPYDLSEGTYASVGLNEWAQSADHLSVRINIGENVSSLSGINIITEHGINCLIENCISIDTEDGGGSWDGTGMGVDISCEDSTIRNCISSGSKGQGISGNLGAGVTIHNCIAVNNGGYGIHIPTSLIMSDFPTGPNRMYNNTTVNNTLGGLRVVRSENLTLYNNIMYNNTADIVITSSPKSSVYTENYNCSSGNTSTNAAGANDIFTDPEIDANYRPSSTSPVLNAGTSILSEYDFYNSIEGTGNHIGAVWPLYRPATNVRFITDNIIDSDTTTLSVDVAELDSDHLITNVKNPLRQTTFRSGSVVEPTIISMVFDSSTISALVIGRHNFSQSTKYRLKLYIDNNFNNLSYDSGNIELESYEAAYDFYEWGEFNWGSIDWGAHKDEEDYVYNYYIVHWLPSTEMQIQSATLEIIPGAIPHVEYMEISRLILGDYFTPAYNLSYNHSLEYIENTKQYRPNTGTLHSDTASVNKRLSFNLNTIPESDRNTIHDKLVGTGLDKDFFVSVFPENSSVEKIVDYRGIFKFKQVPRYREFLHNYYKTTITVEEA